MTPLFYEDSLGAKIADKLRSASPQSAADPTERGGRPLPEHGSADLDVIEDPEALDAAERRARSVDPEAVYAEVREDWVPVFGPSKLSGFWDAAGVSATKITMPLAAKGIAFAWDPYPPEEMPGAAAPFYHLIDRPFTLLVAPGDAEAARELISAQPGAESQFGLPASTDDDHAASSRARIVWIVLIAIGISIIATGIGVSGWR